MAVAAAAALWKTLDRRPAWVMAVSASAAGESRAGALAEERRALAAVLRVVAREHGPAPDVQRETESHDESGRTTYETRTVLLRGDDQYALLVLYRKLAQVRNVRCTDPSRAVRPSDAAFPLLLIAFLLGLATLEPSGFPDEHAAMQPAPVVLNGVVLGLLCAAALLVESGWPRYLLETSVVLAFAPSIVWLVRIRASWTASEALRFPYRATVIATGAAFCGWIMRWVALA